MPAGINYQAVARDKAGNEIKNKKLKVRINILRDDVTGHVEYAELHSDKTTTDAFGLFSLKIGEGSYYAGEKNEFVDIDWGSSAHFLKIEIDFGEGFIPMGTSQFMAVPYALYALNAGSSGSELQILSLEGSVLQIKQGNVVTNSVNLPDVQDLRLSQDHILKISNSASTIDLSPYNKDAQELSTKGDSLKISGGNAIITDNDPTNELQDIKLVGNILSLTNAKGEGVNILPKIIAFRAFKDFGKTLIPAFGSASLVFDSLALNMGDAFNLSNGMFTVPSGCDGLYSFNITYDYNTKQLLRVVKNGKTEEVVLNGFDPAYIAGGKTYHFLYNLNAGDKIQVFVKITAAPASFSNPAIFSGFRVH